MGIAFQHGPINPVGLHVAEQSADYDQPEPQQPQPGILSLFCSHRRMVMRMEALPKTVFRPR